MNRSDPHSTPPGLARTALASLVSLIAAVVWTHALAAVLRAAVGSEVAALAPAGLGLTLAATLAALAGATALRSPAAAARRATLAALAGWGTLAALHPAARVPALALLPVCAGCAALASRLAARLPGELEAVSSRHPRLRALWLAVALLSVVQIGRLGTHMTDAESDWFVSTRHPFFAAHECMDAYVFGAELALRGEPNVYDPSHYPGLDPSAEPVTEMVGMAPEDPFQYPPQFLLLPGLAVGLTRDYGAVRLFWFGLNVTLCLAAVLALAVWVGGAAGRAAGLLSPALLASFPVLHDFQYGQFHFAAVALAVLGSIALQRGRSALGGGLLAFSVLAKLFPVVLLVPFAVERRWKDLGWTAGFAGALTALALLVFGPAPFEAFSSFHLPRLADGSAFAFAEAWPGFAPLLRAGNQGVFGMVAKLGELGVPGADTALAATVGRLFALVPLALGVWVGSRARGASRAQRAIAWLGLLGLGSLASAGAWADYVPLTCVWLLTYLLPRAAGRPFLTAGLALCALMQTTLLGAVPLGGASDPSWMMPLSLIGARLMLATFAGAVLARPRPLAAPERRTARRGLASMAVRARASQANPDSLAAES